MGLGMAKNLLKAGVPLTVWDLREEPMQALASKDVSLASNPAEVARAVDRIFICLPTDAESKQVLFAEQGIFAGNNSIAVVDTTTMNQGATLRLSEQSHQAGITYNDCPISGMPFRADNGTLTMMFGGSSQMFAETEPYLRMMGEFIVHCGDVGMGQLMKAVNNIIYDINIAAFCEVMPLAVKAGLDPKTLSEVLTSASSRSFASEHFVPRILEGRFRDDFSLKAAHKDIVNIEEVADRLKTELPVVEAMVSTYRKAIEMGFGDQPKSAMVKVYEAQLNQEVRLPRRATGKSD